MEMRKNVSFNIKWAEIIWWKSYKSIKILVKSFHSAAMRNSSLHSQEIIFKLNSLKQRKYVERERTWNAPSCQASALSILIHKIIWSHIAAIFWHLNNTKCTRKNEWSKESSSLFLSLLLTTFEHQYDSSAGWLKHIPNFECISKTTLKHLNTLDGDECKLG